MGFAASAGDREVIAVRDYELIMIILTVIGLLLTALKLGRRR